MADLLLQNARWLGADGRFHEGALIARSGWLRLSEREAPGATVFDAAGMLVLPGAIDAHTHLREPGQEHKEGIERGTHAALAGGVTTVLDMPNNLPPIDSGDRLAAKARLFEAKSRVNWGLHVQAPFSPGSTGRRYASAKVYLAKSSSLPAVSSVAGKAAAFRANRLVTIHAEDEERFLPAASFAQARSHHLQRPREAVVAALGKIEKVLGDLAPPERPRVVLCHLATADEVEWLRRMKATGFDVWGETCPHYWRLTEADYERIGPRLKVNPPLRTRADTEAILEGLARGDIDFVSTDHAPHTPEEKADEARAPSGIPSIEWYMPLVLDLVESGRIDWRRFLDVTSGNAARCFGVRDRGGIADGMRADLTLVAKRPGAAKHPIITRAQVDPYPDARYAWRVEATVVNGQIAWTDRTGLDNTIHAGEEVRFG